MGRTFITATTLLGVATILTATSALADSGHATTAIAGPSPAGTGGHDPAIVVASPPQGGHSYRTAPPTVPPTYQQGPISPFPPTHMTPYPPAQWHDGHWYHGEHEHRGGWWWIAGGIWFWYAVPVYPYPDPYLPPTVVMPAPPVRNWYWCDRPAGYYPYVSQCELPWRAIPATPPPPPQ